MERMEMRVQFHPRGEEKAHDHIPSFYGLDGIDHVEFLIAPNKGEEIRPLAKIASGGELSRMMLSIKSLCGSEEVIGRLFSTKWTRESAEGWRRPWGSA